MVRFPIIAVENAGKGYTYKPTVEIIESDTELYVDSNTIGVPQSIKIIRNGGAFHLDKTVASSFTSHIYCCTRRDHLQRKLLVDSKKERL